MLEVAPAGAADAEALTRIARESLPEAWSSESLRAEIEAGALALAAREACELVAFALGPVIADVAELRVLAVTPARRRRGIGRRLLAAWVEQARERGATRVELEVRADNTAARALYHALGFGCEGRRTRYYPGGADALLYGGSL